MTMLRKRLARNFILPIARRVISQSLTISIACKRYPDLMIHFHGINHPEKEWRAGEPFNADRASIA
ncbi:hypothetical protein [Burkholderia stabilis]|uniref:hypothetical protein n=1 Tax=Burkholderia stabilis TaxID=95485 RepID=UPI001F4B6FF9|nr:hypothetical protein [Burkholderia stabilis]HDR9584272.1 hypothetical protein [Burkholderia stabilis]HDR9647598.1 hypothetical protein [Burkholderia stabilis]HDR9657350.1 hypothetical protein [Burkholderia stabilis]HDR9678687.1 hypothetical protein [Burkholderia stabilis]